MPEMKTLNGYEVVDAKAREDIKELQNAGYATEAYVDNAIDNIPEVDLSKHALKSELPTKVSQLQNDSKYITRDEVPETDLSEYITESELNAKGYLTEEDLPESIDTSKFLTKVDNNDQYMWYATTTNANQVIQNHVPIEKIDSKLDVVVGGKTLNNNTIAVREGLQIRVPEAPTNAGHAASKAYVDKAIAAIPEVDLSSYAKKSDIPDISGKADKVHTHSQYLTEHQDISHLAPKSSIPTKVSQLANDSNYLTSIPSEYVTESELNAKGYLTQHQSLADYAKKSDIPTVPTKTSQLTNDSNFLTSVPAEYVTDTELNAKGYLTQHQSLAGYATETYVDDAIAGIDIPEGSGKKALNVRLGYSLNNSEKAVVKEILEYLRTGAADVMSKYEITFRSPGSNMGTAYLVTGLHDFGADRLRVYGQVSDNGTMSYFHTDLYSDTTSYEVALSCTAFASFDNILDLRWKKADSLSDNALWDAEEIYVLAADTSSMDMCYAYLKTDSGPGYEFSGAQCIPLVSYRGNPDATDLSASNMPYIEWQGWGFESYNCTTQGVWYK